MPNLDTIYNQDKAKIDAFISKFDGEVEAVFKEAQRLAQSALSGISQDDVLRYELIWREVLRDAGYYVLVNKLIDNQFDELFSGALKAFEAGGFSTAFTRDDATKIQILKQMKRDFFVRLGDDVGLAVKRELYKYTIADASLATMTEGIASTLEGSNLAKYSQTYARTAIGEFQQEVIDLRAKDVGDGVWVYVGINDGKTRHFCRSVLSRNTFYSDAEKSTLESDHRRAFNCRHRFYKLTKLDAMEAGYASS